MSRHIDADRLKKHFEWWEGEAKAKEFKEIFDEIIDAQPTADVVEVVRCKDCKWRDESTCLIHGAIWKDNDFCSMGERSEDG